MKNTFKMLLHLTFSSRKTYFYNRNYPLKLSNDRNYTLYRALLNREP